MSVTRQALDSSTIRDIARENGWTFKPTSYFSWWSFELVRGNENILVRVVNSKLTQFTHADGTGVVLKPTRNKFRELQAILQAPVK